MNVEMWHRVRKHGVRGFKHGACEYYYRDNFTCEDFYGDIIIVCEADLYILMLLVS